MSRLEEIVNHFNSFGSLAKPSKNQLKSLREKHPDIPQDYVRFLEFAGHGNLGEIHLYDGPVEAATIFPNAFGELSDILLIGDDSQGYCFGFDPTDGWKIVEVSPRGEIDRSIESDVLSFFGRYMQ